MTDLGILLLLILVLGVAIMALSIAIVNRKLISDIYSALTDLHKHTLNNTNRHIKVREVLREIIEDIVKLKNIKQNG